MKTNFLILSLVAILLFSCIENDKNIQEKNPDTTETPLSLKGTWELKGFYNYNNDVVVDSFSNNTISRQIKMFSDTKVMWCKLLKTDSIEFFGYGSYNYDEGHLTEILEFGSAFMNQVIEEQKEFKFQLELRQDSFQQIQLDDDGHKIYSENYVRID